MAIVILCSLYQPLANSAGISIKSSVERAENTDKERNTVVLPYAYKSSSWGSLIGVGGMVSGAVQEQFSAGITVFTGDKTNGFAFGFWDYNFRFADRLFVSADGMLGDYPNQRAYAEPTGNFVDPATRAGSHGSAYENYIEADGYDHWYEITFEYAFPFGLTENANHVSYQTRGGLVTNPSDTSHWNPLKSGALVLGVRQFNRHQGYATKAHAEDVELALGAIQVGLKYDHTDFAINPSTGSSQFIAISYDSGLFDDNSWAFLELEGSKYFNLGADRFAKQRVLALNAWAGYSPQWNLTKNDDGTYFIDHKTPYKEGATLGGYYRMKGYRSNRFHDKAAVYGAAELRYTLRANPIKGVSWLKMLNLDWFQLVGFVEAGRVAPTFRPNVLLSDLNVNYGLGLRAMTGGAVVRASIARSEEGTGAWMMVGHPF